MQTSHCVFATVKKGMPHKSPEERKKYQKEYHTAYYANNKEYRDKQKTRTKKRNARIRKINLENRKEYLKNHPCIDCGENDPVCLDFHHIKGNKKYSIANAVTKGLSWETILIEINKCVVVCSNCHRKRHAALRLNKK